MLSVNQVSKQFCCSEQYVRKLIREGKIQAERIGSTWVIPQEVIDELSIDDFKRSNLGKVPDRVSMKKHSKNKLNVLSFFSGAMGLDIGLKESGMNVLLACEFDEPTKRTIVKNDSEIGLIGNLLSYSVEEILAYANLNSTSQVDVIVGGPPCQAFSTAGKRMGFQDERGNVFLKFIDVIKSIRPKYVVIENVRGLMSVPMTIDIDDNLSEEFDLKSTKGSSLFFVKSKLEEAGYKVSFNLYSSANFGVPQIRERVVIIGTLSKNPVPYLTPTHSEFGNFGLKPWLTFKDAVSGLDNKECSYIRFSEKRLQYIKMLKPGQNWRDLPVEIQPIAMGNSYLLGGGKTGFYRRLSWDKPAPTLVTHPAMPATELAHPIEDRPLSVEEYKRVQQFPDNWQIEGTIIEQYKQIGNAVPVGLGLAIGKEIVAHHKQRILKSVEGFPYSRYRNTSDKEWEMDFLKRAKKTLVAED
ncbi:DNA cytosine methyltransferase [Fluviicola sp.]|uniref:DNA cytosine methyltransferase n=1 Tax=Fluviicola sp. TaxID=1917219 RepID=UPI002613074D|nr:DNA cytosine methyltransferase [Fluviicola sp.]